MTERLKEVLEDFRRQHIDVSDEEAERVRQYCIRKMKIIGKDDDEYMLVLFRSELMDYVFRRYVNDVNQIRECVA